MKDFFVRPVKGVAEWALLYDTVERPHMVQSWAYGQAKESTGSWKARRLVIERASVPVAICQILDKKVAGVRVASRINRGPLLLSKDEADVAGAYRALRARWKYLTGGVLLIAPALADDDKSQQILERGGFRRRGGKGWCSAYLDLRIDASQLRKNLASNWRGHLSRAERSGLTMRYSSEPVDVDWMLARHVESMQVKNYSGPSAELLKGLYQAAPNQFIVFQACLEGQPVGGLIVYHFGDAAEYYIGWYGPEGRKVNAGNFLVWNAALELQRRGCRFFDLGGYSSDDKYGHFKQQMNGVEYHLANEWMAF